MHNTSLNIHAGFRSFKSTATLDTSHVQTHMGKMPVTEVVAASSAFLGFLPMSTVNHYVSNMGPCVSSMGHYVSNMDPRWTGEEDVVGMKVGMEPRGKCVCVCVC